jgi:hypothetical protein
MIYKLTDSKNQTHNAIQWGPNITHTATGKHGQGLCSDEYIHAYAHPLLSIFFDPIHGGFGEHAHLWESESPDTPLSDGTKIGVRTLTTIREITIPTITDEQRVEIAIRCALSAPHSKSFSEWAKKWLDGSDKSSRAAVEDEAVEWAARLAAAAVVEDEAVEWAARLAAAAVRSAARTNLGVEWAGVWATQLAARSAARAEQKANIDILGIIKMVVEKGDK